MNNPGLACWYPGCPTLNCAEHKRQRASANQRARRGDPDRMQTNDARWLQLRKMVLARDPVCMICHNEPSHHVDHVLAIRQGGAKWQLDNLQGLCASCHSIKTRREIREGRA